jgi:uncharacterized protein
MGHKELSDLVELEPIIQQAQVCRIGLCGDKGPYVVAMNFGYEDGCVYLHSSPGGRKIEMIRADSRVCFQVETGAALREADTACAWGMRFKSVVGFGRAELVEDPEEKVAALNIIMDHYSEKAPHGYSAEHLERVAVIKIPLREATGRLQGYDEA